MCREDVDCGFASHISPEGEGVFHSCILFSDLSIEGLPSERSGGTSRTIHCRTAFNPTISPSLSPSTSAPSDIPTQPPSFLPSLNPSLSPTPSPFYNGTCSDVPNWGCQSEGSINESYCDSNGTYSLLASEACCSCGHGGYHWLTSTTIFSFEGDVKLDQTYSFSFWIESPSGEKSVMVFTKGSQSFEVMGIHDSKFKFCPLLAAPSPSIECYSSRSFTALETYVSLHVSYHAETQTLHIWVQDELDQTITDVPSPGIGSQEIDTIVIGDTDLNLNEMQYTRHAYNEEEVRAIYSLHESLWPVEFPSAILVPSIIGGVFTCAYLIGYGVSLKTGCDSPDIFILVGVMFAVIDFATDAFLVHFLFSIDNQYRYFVLAAICTPMAISMFLLLEWYTRKKPRNNMVGEWLRGHSDFFLPLMVLGFTNPYIMALCWSRILPLTYFQMPIQFRDEYKLVGRGSIIQTMLEDIPMVFLNILIIRDTGNYINYECIVSLSATCLMILSRVIRSLSTSIDVSAIHQTYALVIKPNVPLQNYATKIGLKFQEHFESKTQVLVSESSKDRYHVLFEHVSEHNDLEEIIRKVLKPYTSDETETAVQKPPVVRNVVAEILKLFGHFHAKAGYVEINKETVNLCIDRKACDKKCLAHIQLGFGNRIEYNEIHDMHAHFYKNSLHMSTTDSNLAFRDPKAEIQGGEFSEEDFADVISPLHVYDNKEVEEKAIVIDDPGAAGASRKLQIFDNYVELQKQDLAALEKEKRPSKSASTTRAKRGPLGALFSCFCEPIEDLESTIMFDLDSLKFDVE